MPVRLALKLVIARGRWVQTQTAMDQSGYLHPGYAASLSEFGSPLALARAGGWLLQRPVPVPAPHPSTDAMGTYPYLVCQDWSVLEADLSALDGDLVAISCVPDPFGVVSLETLQRCFPDVCVHFKDHLIADLTQSPDQIVSTHHRACARRAHRHVTVEFCQHPVEFLDRWVELFDETTRRLSITGIRAFSREAFAQQLALPGAVMSQAWHGGKMVAAHVQLVHGDVAHAHLAAATAEARQLGADYALYDAELRYYADKVHWIDWGGDAGLSFKTSALSTFKRGWSNATRPAYFCGRISNRSKYDELVRMSGATEANYFPAYRAGEFS